MRQTRMPALGALLLALVLGACTTGGGTSPSGASGSPASASAGASGSGAAGGTIASALVLGAPPECPERPFCLIGLKDTYGLEFKEYRPLDSGGPLTVEAVKSGDVDVGLLFTSDPAISAESFVLLKDDKQLQLADNIIPVIRQDLLDESPPIADLLNPWMAKLTQEELIGLNQAVADQEDPADVVSAWLTENGAEESDEGSGVSLTLGSANFPESETLGELFAQILEGAGYDVERKFQIGARDVYFPAIESGEIDLLPEYAATILEHANDSAGEATTDAQETAELLRSALEERGLTALDPAPATDQNGFVVTQETADELGLAKMSDLAKPAP
ncbi:MAG: ABC transporter [Chloroflexi bacterium]|nr:ABC transporter [Chloroflexota bacterium]